MGLEIVFDVGYLEMRYFGSASTEFGGFVVFVRSCVARFFFKDMDVNIVFIFCRVYVFVFKLKRF